jgi:hypothetical protein
MFRRSFIFGLTSLPFFATLAKSQDNKSVTWKVPKNVNRIRVRSWDQEGNAVMDTNLKVRPDQVFKIDVLD